MSSDIPSPPVPALPDFVAGELDRQAERITDAWLSDVGDEAEATSSGEPRLTRLREQIPDVVRSVAGFVRAPSERVRSAVIDRLRLHIERRREQGYDVQQLFTEYEILSRLVFDAFTEAVRGYAGPAKPIEVAELAGRLRESLMEITSEAVGLYRQRELEHRRELAQRLASFANAITHELKNPLGAAQAGTQMLRDKDVVASADQQERFTKLILRNLIRIHDLIDDIRVLALAPGVDGLERQVGLAQVIAKAVAEMRESAEAKGVALQVDEALPDPSVDAARVEIVLVNLIGNAIKYSDPGKAQRWVRISAQRSEGGDIACAWMVTVRDNGLGIPRELQGSVFQRQFRGHPQVADGTGLGLTIAKEVTAAGGGQISFDSEEGKGTSFYVVIPERRITRQSSLCDAR